MTRRSTPLKSRLDKWLERKNSSNTISSNSEHRSEGDLLPLSFGQLRLWLLQQMNPDSAFYIYAESYQIKGNLQLDDFVKSFRQVVDRHEILRATFPSEGGKPWQKINPNLEPEVLVRHLSKPNSPQSFEEADAILNTEAQKSFDLSNGPLVRLVIVQLDQHLYRVAVVMHHIITDKWSMNILREEWSSLYRGNDLPPLDFQYTDFAIDQRDQQWMRNTFNFGKRNLPVSYR